MRAGSAEKVSGRGRRRGGRLAGVLVVALVAVAALAPLAGAETRTVGLGGWRVQSSALVAGDGTTISQPGFADSAWLGVKPDDAGAVGTEVGALVQNGTLPAGLLLDEHGQLLRLHEPRRPRHDPAVLGAVVVPHQLPAPARRRPLRAADRQRRRRAGRRVGQRQRGRHAGDASRAPSRATRSTSRSLLHAGRELARARGLSERPDQDVHARQRRLDADPAGQQHRHPVPGPAARLGRARDLRRARRRRQTPPTSRAPR